MHIEEHLQLPRLTSTLRAFSKVSKKFTESDPDLDKKSIKKRKEQLNKQKELGTSNAGDSSKEALSWEHLTRKLVPTLGDAKFAKLKTSLDKIKLTIAKQFLNEDFNDQAVLNEASIFIFEVFYDFRNSDNAMSNSNFQHADKIMKKLREKFGQFARNLFDTCKEVMETVYNELKNSNRIHLLDELLGSRHIAIVGAEENAKSDDDSYFGENIKFVSFYDKLGKPDTVSRALSSDEEDSDRLG